MIVTIFIVLVHTIVMMLFSLLIVYYNDTVIKAITAATGVPSITNATIVMIYYVIFFVFAILLNFITFRYSSVIKKYPSIILIPYAIVIPSIIIYQHNLPKGLLGILCSGELHTFTASDFLIPVFVVNIIFVLFLNQFRAT